MKKRFSLFVATVLTIVALPVAAFAAPSFDTIKGTIYNGSGGVVNNALVTVICDSHVKRTHSASDGSYSVQYNVKQCPDGTIASVTATLGNKGGEKNAKVNGTTIDNVTIVNVSLPEFGLVAGIGATLIGGGAFLVIRRRQLSGHQS